MSVLNQKTINDSLNFIGIGLHSGKKVSMTLHPAPPNHGIIFKRSNSIQKGISKEAFLTQFKRMIFIIQN